LKKKKEFDGRNILQYSLRFDSILYTSGVEYWLTVYCKPIKLYVALHLTGAWSSG